MESPSFIAILSNALSQYLRSVLVMLAVCVPLNGCGRRVAETTDIESAKAALTLALEAWKSGDSVEQLKSLSPPVYVADEQWQDGTQLLDYALSNEGTQYGPNVKFQVELTITIEKKREQRTRVEYLVTTKPATTIARLE